MTLAVGADARGGPSGKLGKRAFGPSAGLVFDPRPFLAIPALGGPDLIEQGFPFTVGAASPGINPAAINAQTAVSTG
jgi:hypothetical protein